jgi:hypothetical protein
MAIFGENYPQQIERDGQVFKLRQETRWNRRFSSDDGKTHTHVSRFYDGSAFITPEQLEAEWMKWNESERKDFCDAVSWVPKEGRERICRFLRQHGSLDVLHNCVLTIAGNLPTSESVPWLSNCIAQRPPGTASNFLQALAYTKAPEGISIIRRRLGECFDHADFAKNDPFLNWIAAEAVNCIQDLIEQGSASAEFRSQALRLASHSCTRVRESFDWRLRKYYAGDADFDINQ